MSKRGAESQKTKNDESSEDEQVGEPGSTDTPLAPVQGRVIKGLPKRGGSAASPAPAPAAPAPTPAVVPPAPAANASPFSSFNFGSNTTSNAFGNTSAPSSFAFGSTTNSAKPTDSSATATSPAFYVGASSNPVSTPSTTVPANTSSSSAAAPSNSPFAGFSFGQSAAAPTSTVSKPAVPSTTPPFGFGTTKSGDEATGTKRAANEVEAPAPKKAFTGFSFSKPPEPSAASSAPSIPSASTASAASGLSANNVSNVNGKAIEFGKVEAAPKSSSKAPVPTQANPPPEGEVVYYTAVRGLNTSILAFLTTTLENDAFTDLSRVFPALQEQYQKHLDEAATRGGWRPESIKPTQLTSSIVAPKTGFAVPAVPASSGFTLPKPTTSAPAAGGFKPTLPAASTTTSPFSFGGFESDASTITKPETRAKKPSAEVTKLVEDVVSGRSSSPEKKQSDIPIVKPFQFGAPVPQPPNDSKKGTSTLFSFAPSGPLHPPDPESKTFTPSKNVETPSTSTPPAKLGKFGPGGSQPQLSFGGAGGTPGTPGSAKPVGFNFGASSGGSGGFSLGSGVPFASQAGLGTSATSSPLASFSFGAKSGEASKGSSTPAFTFGSSGTTSQPQTTSPTKASTSNTPSFTFGSDTNTSTGFSFGGVAKSSTTPSTTPAQPAFSSFGHTMKNVEDGGDTGTSSGDTAETPGPPSKNLAESLGEGEEGEETVFEKRAKLYKLESGKFNAVGLGPIKLKRVKGEGKRKRRLLMRTDGNGAVILNMSINETFEPKNEGNSVSFLGFDLDGKPCPYTLRMKTPEMAKEMVRAIQNEVEEIKKE